MPLAQVDPREIGADQPDVAHYSAHVRIDQDGLGEVNPREFGAEQVRAAQIGANHAAVLRTRATHIGFG